MKKRNKVALLALGLVAIGMAASSCTANFCTNKEKSRIAFVIEPGVSEYVVSSEAPVIENADINKVGTNVYQVVKFNEDKTFAKSAQLNAIISSAKANGIYTPANEYFYKFDEIVLNNALTASNLSVDDANITVEQINEALKVNGYLKFYRVEDDNVYANYKAINSKLRNDPELDLEKAASVDFENAYISAVSQVVETFRSCITTVEGEYGNYGSQNDTVHLEGVTWGEAWGKGGHVIEGLIVYPVAWLVDTFANAFAGPARDFTRGVPQLLSLILVTVIVRLFIFLVTIKSTLSQQKMTALQPELAKIQQKYPNANTNQAQKQRLAEEQMRLYKKHKVNPLSQLLVLIVQFPIFIGVWGAMQGSAVLATGAVFASDKWAGLHLSDSIWTILRAGPASNVSGFWAAFGLIILMSVSQFISMKVPQWIQKARTKKVARMGVNPAQKSQNRTANIISYVMLAMIIIMGFTLPAAMGVYWFIGAIVSLIQTLLTQYVFIGKKRKK
ncbi:MAG: YidC/Oxa1 family membrane protein insertase [Bacilli bacterium]|nr:YidC/Oxa1 family membrane protein insertase [Bacilli bacterium]